MFPNLRASDASIARVEWRFVPQLLIFSLKFVLHFAATVLAYAFFQHKSLSQLLASVHAKTLQR
jgi:hypothetical protein